MTFEEVRRRVEECSIMSRKSKNFVVKNGYTFGSWLLLAERLYRRERFLNRNHSLPKQFAAWMKAFGISKLLPIYTRGFISWYLKHHD